MLDFKPELLEEVPIVGIIRNLRASALEPVLDTFVKSGLTTLEITMNTEGAIEMIEDAVNAYGRTLNIGAGTVCSLNDLDEAIGAGARFIVTPVVDEAVIKKCVALNIPVFPGALTPTEIYTAWSLGATMVKVFPAGTVGSRYFKDVSSPLDQVRFLATGGIGLHHIAEYWSAGVRAFGIGSSLFDPSFIEDEDWTGLLTHFELFYERVRGLVIGSKTNDD